MKDNVFSEVTEALFMPGSPLATQAEDLSQSSKPPSSGRPPSLVYGEVLLDCERLVTRALRFEDAQSQEATAAWVELVNQDHALQEAAASLQAHFDELRAQYEAAKLAPVFLTRHDEAVQQHQASHALLLSLVTDLRDAGSDPIQRRAAMQLLDDYFQIHPVSPLRKLAQGPESDPTQARPATSVVIDRAELGLSPEGHVLNRKEVPPQAIQLPPVPADLSETLDVVFTPEINELAAELDNDALKIFNWVMTHVHFDPYVGSRRGAAETLRLKAGNDTDQASLLIALLRASGFPCRYTTGTIEMTPEAATNWLGLEDAFTAGSLLATAGMEGVTISDGNEVAAIQCRRVWVEAYVPYSSYRGAGAATGESLWIRLDPAFKPYSNRFGEDVITASGFDADDLLSNYFTAPDPNTVMTRFEAAMATYLGTLDPPLTLEENELLHELSASDLPWLPANLPNRILTLGESWAALPADHRYRLRFLVSGEGATLDHSLTLPEIAGKQVTLSYIGATTADQNLIDSSGGFFGVAQPSLVKVKPQLRVNGCVVATGTGGVTLGVIQTSQIFFTDAKPGGTTESISNRLIAGNYEGHAIDTGRVQIDPETRVLSCPEDFTGGFLHHLGMRYLELNDQADRKTAGIANAQLWKGVSNAILSQQVKVLYSGATPLTFRYAGLSVDADRAGATPFSSSGSNITYDFSRIRGAQSSQNENLVFELNLGRESVSTIKILSLASLLDIPLFEITQANAATLIPQLTHRTQTKNDVIAQINAGKIVTIPRDTFTYFDWRGTGYIHLDPATGTGGYIIDGGISGGATADEDDKKPGCEKVTNIDISPPGGVYSNCQKEPVEITVTLIGYDEECEVAGSRTARKTITPSSMAPGIYNFPFGSAGDCGCSIDNVTIQIKDSPVLFQDSEGRTPVAQRLEIAPPTVASEDIRCRLADGPPGTRWTATGATPSERTGNDVMFNVEVPTHIVRSGLPAMVSMLTPPDPAIIRLADSAESCDGLVMVYPFSSREFEFSREKSDAPAAKRAGEAGEALGETLLGLYNIVKFLEDSEERMQAVRTLSRTMRGPVQFEPSTKVAFSFKDKIEEDPKSNFVVYILDAGGIAEAGVGLKFPVLTTAFGGVPPPLAEAAIEVIIEGKVAGRIAGIAEFHRGRGWIKAIYPQATATINVSVGLGARATLLNGAAEMTVTASTGIQGLGKAYPQIKGRQLQLPLEFQAEIGGLTAGYKVGVLWGKWEKSGSWKLYEPRKVPAEPKSFDLLNLLFP